MFGQFDHPRDSLAIRTNNSQRARTQNTHVVGIDPKIAAILLLNMRLSIRERLEFQTPGYDKYPF
jgi:hypothetical protein